MSDKIIIEPKADHVQQWVSLVREYAAKRGSDEGPNKKAVPRTTNGDVQQLTRYWHNEYLREVMFSWKPLDKDPSSRKRWKENKARLDRQLGNADPNALFPENAWFWYDATSKLSIYLESRKAIPSRAELIIESVSEAAQEAVDAAKDVATGAGKSLWGAVKVGALIIGSAVGAAIVIPPLVRAFKSKE